MICHPAELDEEETTKSSEREESILLWPQQDNNDPKKIKFDLDGKVAMDKRIQIPEDPTSESVRITSAQLLDIHQKYGHVGFSRLKEMARQGIISSKYATCPIPVCSACMFAKARRKRWRDKPRSKYENFMASYPGERVSVDQLESPSIPGLIAQMTGTLTTKRYKYATVFVDQYTKMGYVHLQKSPDVDETLKAKQAFDEYARQRGVEIKSYQADNGIFRANRWVNSCRESKQPLTFTGVNVHHQNGLAERRIGLLQDLTRAMMIHAQQKWPGAVTPNLWPYAMRMANDNLNETPNM